jgi:hypothetical protein
VLSAATASKYLAPSRKENPHPALKNRSLQEYSAAALLTPDPNVGAHPDHLPLVAATGMLLLKAHHITNSYLHL